MNKNAKRWVKALRSGEFKQAKKYLTLTNMPGVQLDCCMGVGCKVFNKDPQNADKQLKLSLLGLGVVTYNNEAKLLPNPVVKYLGLRENDGAHKIGTTNATSLTSLNDNGKTFSEIADIIESEPEGLFVGESPLSLEQQEFILYRLIPFILRDQGDHFVMSYWKVDARVISSAFHPVLDDVQHSPNCGTVCCIGGSVSHLTGAIVPDNYPSGLNVESYREYQHRELGAALGLTGLQAHGLFYSWQYAKAREKNRKYAWPKVFSDRFEKAQTPLAKAEVACDLLRLIARVGGSVLDRSED